MNHLARGDDVSESLRASKRAVVERFGPESIGDDRGFSDCGGWSTAYREAQGCEPNRGCALSLSVRKEQHAGV